MVKQAARFALHNLGGLALLRGRNRKRFAVPMFHSFYEQDRANIEALCAHMARYFEPVSLSAIVDDIQGGVTLPHNALTVTASQTITSSFPRSPLSKRAQLITPPLLTNPFTGQVPRSG